MYPGISGISAKAKEGLISKSNPSRIESRGGIFIGDGKKYSIQSNEIGSEIKETGL